MGARTLRLPAKGVGHAAAHPRVPHGVEALHEAKGAVVERVARQGGVVGVHVALAVAHAEPLCDETPLALTHLAKHERQMLGGGRRRLLHEQVRKVATQRMLGQFE